MIRDTFTGHMASYAFPLLQCSTPTPQSGSCGLYICQVQYGSELPSQSRNSVQKNYLKTILCPSG